MYRGFIQKLIQRPVSHASVALIGLAGLLYGAYGYPTPDAMRTLEWGIAGLLMAALMMARPWHIFSLKSYDWGRLFFLFGLSIPLLVGVLSGHEIRLMIRDILPFIFMMMPVLYAKILWQKQSVAILSFAVLSIGLLFALRCLSPESILGASRPLDYLANMPSLLLAAVFGVGSGLYILCERISVKNLCKAGLFAVFGVLCLWPILETVQRASAGVFAVSICAVWCVCFMRFPKRAVVIGGASLVICILIFSDFKPFLSALFEKNMLAGSNMRWSELAAVWEHISRSPISLIFGAGWGAQYASPAVAGITVNYTHSLLSALLLKTGLLGLILGLFYTGSVLCRLLDRFSQFPVLVIAILGPVLIDIALYASYKSLDFGLVLLLAAAIYHQPIASQQPVLYAKD